MRPEIIYSEPWPSLERCARLLRWLVCGTVVSIVWPPSSVSAGRMVLSWDAPTENTDWSPLSDLAGYRAYWGCGADQGYTNVEQIDNAQALTYTLEPLPDGVLCRAVLSAFNAQGAESEPSNEASVVTQASTVRVTSTRIEPAEWTCRDASGEILTSHTRQDKAQEACTNRALASPGVVFEIRPSGYRIVVGP